MEVIKYCYSVLYLLSCEVYKWLKIHFKKITSGELLSNKVRKLFIAIMWTKTPKTMQYLVLILLLLMQNLFGKMADILEKFKK